MRVIAIAIVVSAVTGCWTDKTSPTTPPPVANPAPSPAPPHAAPPPPLDPLATLPIECQRYGAAIHKLATCDQLPQAARDAMAKGFDDAAATWAALPADAKAQLATACNDGLDAVTQAAKSMCPP